MRSGFKALKEIKYYQSHGELLIPKKKFELLVREIAQDSKSDMLFQKKALLEQGLQAISGTVLVKMLSMPTSSPSGPVVARPSSPLTFCS